MLRRNCPILSSLYIGPFAVTLTAELQEWSASLKLPSLLTEKLDVFSCVAMSTLITSSSHVNVAASMYCPVIKHKRRIGRKIIDAAGAYMARASPISLWAFLALIFFSSLI